MLRKQEKNAVTRGSLLGIGWGWGLDRFYEGDKKKQQKPSKSWKNHFEDSEFTLHSFLKSYRINYIFRGLLGNVFIRIVFYRVWDRLSI